MEEDKRSVRSLIVRYLIAHTQCSGCGRRYGPGDVHIQDRKGDVWLAAVTCRHCGLQGFIMAAIAREEQEPLEAIGEPDERELDMFEVMGPIGSEEILDLHCFLEGFHGDFVQLLRQRG